jgi:hypothetical protein
MVQSASGSNTIVRVCSVGPTAIPLIARGRIQRSSTRCTACSDIECARSNHDH